MQPREALRRALEQAEGPALVAFLTAGYPEPEGFLEVLGEVEEVADAVESAAMIQSVLDGQPGPARDIVVLNAAAAIWLATPGSSQEAAASQANDAIENGAALELLGQLARLSKGA